MIINIIKSNIVWIKDVFAIIFSGTATVIAILTYLRAKDTLLQPVRTEVIKRQSELLTEILELLSKREFSIDHSLDYIKIAHMNTFKVLNDYGYIFKDHDKILDEIKKESYGIMFCGENNIVEDAIVVGMFPEQDHSDQTSEEIRKAGLEKLQLLKKGVTKIDKILISQEHMDFIRKISDYANNPFLPQSVQVVLQQILYEVNLNLKNYLKDTLKDFLVRFARENKTEISPTGVYNEWNHRRIHHNQVLIKLRETIRDYLKIDRMP